MKFSRYRKIQYIKHKKIRHRNKQNKKTYKQNPKPKTEKTLNQPNKTLTHKKGPELNTDIDSWPSP